MEYFDVSLDVQLFVGDVSELYTRSNKGHSGSCIFYIDDSEIDTWLAKQVIVGTRVATEILTASNGDEGLKAIKEYYYKNKRLPEIIITDLQMPRMDGFELIRLIKKLAYFSEKETQIILISAGLDEEDLKRINDLHIKKVLLKPLDKDELINVLNKITF